MRLRATLALLLIASPSFAQTVGLPVVYDLIGQRPDAAGAVSVPHTETFAACCSAFSASTEGIEFPTPPAQWIKFQVHLMGRTPLDAVRLRLFRYVPADGGGWATENVYFPASVPPLLHAPRTVGFWIDPAAWAAVPPGELMFVVETRGSPLIYGAKLVVRYRVEAPVIYCPDGEVPR